MSRRRTLFMGVAITATLLTALPAQAFLRASSTPSTTIGVDTLAPPGITYISTRTDVTLTVGAPGSGPTPDRYVVTRDSVVVCTLTAPGACPAISQPTATTRTYTVTAELGTNWRRTTTVDASTAPPSTSLKLAGGSDTGVSGDGLTNSSLPLFVLRAPRAASDYQVTVRRMDTGAQLGQVTVTSGTGNVNFFLPTPLAASFTGSTSKRYDVIAESNYSGQVTTTAMSPADALRVWTGRPTPTGVLLTNGPGIAGTMDAGDTLTIQSDRPLWPASVCAAFPSTPGTAGTVSNIVVFLDAAPGGDRLTLRSPSGTCSSTPNSIRVGTVALGAAYLDPLSPAASVAFVGSAIGIDSTWTTLTITLGAADLTGGAVMATGVTPTTPSLGVTTPDPRDQAANSFAGTPFVPAVASSF